MVQDVVIDNSFTSVPMGGPDSFADNNGATEGKGLSSVAILVIVLVVCGILGIGLGILAGRRSANK